MVAYTTPDCLPYFEGTDSPCVNTGTVCEPSTVWCDFAELVEAKLDEYDVVVRRTASSVPMAWVETTEDVVFNIAVNLNPEFTTVRADTDNMVDLDALSYGFVINTPGLYEVWGYIYGVNDAGNISDNTPGFTLSILPSNTAPAVSFMEADSGSVIASQIVTSHADLVTPVRAGQRIVMTISSGGSTVDEVLFSKIAMGASWVGDLP